MSMQSLPIVLAAAAACAFFTPTTTAQTETDLLQIAQSGIGSNGFGTVWRGQDVELTEDAWLTRIEFQTGSATPFVSEVRLMTSVPNATTLRTVTSFTTTSTEVEAVLSQPYLLRAGVRYTVWFHQNTTSPRGTYGCDLTRVDPTWAAYHTNVDPTQAPGPGEPSYFWAYQYGTNMRLIGYDNLEITGTLAPGGSASIQLDAQPMDLAALLMGIGTYDQSFPGFIGPLRLDPSLLIPATFIAPIPASGAWITTLQIPNDPNLSGAVLYFQGAYDLRMAGSVRFSPMEALRIQ